ncbi:MAG TPA: protein kinase, partial [Planctomycetaceae bacterium]
KLSHWNTVSIFDYGRTEDGTFYYVMEYLPGLSLADLVSRFGPLPVSRAIHLLRQICRALYEAHGVGLVHRDIKPANIFVSRLGGVCDVAKLLDFGLVELTVSDAKVEKAKAGISGSPRYMSPEQAIPYNVPDARSDIYSVGATAYYLLTGRVPFEGQTLAQVMMAHSREPLVPPSRHRAEVPSDVDEVVIKCLAKRPVDRFADAHSLEQALAACSDADGWTDAQAAGWWQEHLESDRDNGATSKK